MKDAELIAISALLTIRAAEAQRNGDQDGLLQARGISSSPDFASIEAELNIRKAERESFRIVRYKKTGDLYSVRSNLAKIKDKHEWVDAYMYTPIEAGLDNSIIYVREKKDFEAKFEAVTTPLPEVSMPPQTFKQLLKKR